MPNWEFLKSVSPLANVSNAMRAGAPLQAGGGSSTAEAPEHRMLPTGKMTQGPTSPPKRIYVRSMFGNHWREATPEDDARWYAERGIEYKQEGGAAGQAAPHAPIPAHLQGLAGRVSPTSNPGAFQDFWNNVMAARAQNAPAAAPTTPAPAPTGPVAPTPVVNPILNPDPTPVAQAPAAPAAPVQAPVAPVAPAQAVTPTETPAAPTGPLSPLVQTGVPQGGYAAQAIQDYLSGAPTDVRLSYGMDDSRAEQDARLRAARDRIDLQEAGIDPTGIVYDDYVQPREEGESRELTPIELQRLRETGHAGQVLGENTIGGWREWGTDSPQGLTAEQRLAEDYSHLGNIPGVSTALMGGVGGYNRSRQRALREQGGVTYNIGGQPVTVGPNGEVVGTLPQGVSASHIRDFAVDSGQLNRADIDTRPGWLKKGWQSIQDVIGQKQTHDAAEAAAQRQREATARAAAAAYHDRDWGDDHQGSAQAFTGSRLAERAAAQGAGGKRAEVDTRRGFNTGGLVMDKDDIRIARSMVEDAPLAQGSPRVATPAGMPQQRNRGMELVQLAAPLLMNKVAPGSGQFSSVLFNEGGKVDEKKRTLWSLLDKTGVDPAKYKKFRGKDDNLQVQYKEGGGMMRAPLGGGQTKKALEDARRIGALTQEEFLKAMAHGGYLNFGGKVSGVKYKATGGEITREAEVKFHGPISKDKGE